MERKGREVGREESEEVREKTDGRKLENRKMEES